MSTALEVQLVAALREMVAAAEHFAHLSNKHDSLLQRLGYSPYQMRDEDFRRHMGLMPLADAARKPSVWAQGVREVSGDPDGPKIGPRP